MHPEIDKLIEMALADGIVSDKEREIILRKAEKLGLDGDEVEMYLESCMTSINSAIIIKDKDVTLDSKTSKNDVLIKSNLISRKVRHIPAAILDKEYDLKLEINKYNIDYEKYNIEKKSILEKKNELKNKIEISSSFLESQYSNICMEITILKDELNIKSEDFFTKLIEEINTKVSSEFGKSELIINNLKKVIGLSKNEIIEFIANNGIWRNDELIKKRKIKRYFFRFIGITFFLYFFLKGQYIFSLILFLIPMITSGLYSESMNSDNKRFSSNELKLILIEIVEKYISEFEDMSLMNNKIRSLVSMKNKINSINFYKSK